MDKPRIKQQLRRGFFALAIVGALLTLPKAQAQSIPASGSTTDCEHIISVRTAGPSTIITSRCSGSNASTHFCQSNVCDNGTGFASVTDFGSGCQSFNALAFLKAVPSG